MIINYVVQEGEAVEMETPEEDKIALQTTINTKEFLPPVIHFHYNFIVPINHNKPVMMGQDGQGNIARIADSECGTWKSNSSLPFIHITVMQQHPGLSFFQCHHNSCALINHSNRGILQFQIILLRRQCYLLQTTIMHL